LDLEFQELTKEVARIAKTTDYNGKNMLNWSEDPNLSFGAIGNKYELQKEVGREVDKISSLMIGFTSSADTGKALIQAALNALITIAQADPATTHSIRQDVSGTGEPPYPPQGEYETGSLMDELQKAIDAIGDPYDETNFPALKDKQLAEQLKERLNIIVNNNSQPKTDSLLYLYSNMLENDMTQAASYTLHIGPNYSFGMGGKWANEMTITYISLNPGSLGLSTKNIRTQNNSTEVIDHLDRIIKSVSGVRAKIGTYINRLEYTINNISSLEYNTQDAESRIRDTDFAQSTTDFTRNQILVQSATSMLAQANTLPQTALSLING